MACVEVQNKWRADFNQAWDFAKSDEVWEGRGIEDEGKGMMKNSGLWTLSWLREKGK